MPLLKSLVTAGVVFLGVVPAFAQAQLGTPWEIAIGCSPLPQVEVPPATAPRVLGVQDEVGRGLYSQRDLLAIGSGTTGGLALGQQYFIRRPERFGTPYTARATGTTTVGWARIVAVNETAAIAAVDHACDAILQNDYLVPYVAPVVPADADREPAGELDFNALSRIVGGSERRQMGAAGDFMVVDRGADTGLSLGARFAIYRDPRLRTLPLVPIGEAIVTSVGGMRSIVRITRSRDGVLAGDYLVPRK
jgi:hypothetical protein